MSAPSSRTSGYLAGAGTVALWTGFILLSRLAGRSPLTAWDTLALRLGTAALLFFYIATAQPGVQRLIGNELEKTIELAKLRGENIDAEAYQRVMQVLDGGLHYSRDPDEVAVKVSRLMQPSSPYGVHFAAHGVQRLSVLLNKVLPSRLFERLMMRHYH